MELQGTQNMLVSHSGTIAKLSKIATSIHLGSLHKTLDHWTIIIKCKINLLIKSSLEVSIDLVKVIPTVMLHSLT